MNAGVCRNIMDINEYYTPLEIMTKWGISKERLDGLRKHHRITTKKIGIRIFLKKPEVEYVLRKLNPTGYMTMQEARIKLRFSKVHMLRWRKEGKIKLERTDRHWICRIEEVDRILAERGRYDEYIYGNFSIAKAFDRTEQTIEHWRKSGYLTLEKYYGRLRIHKDIVKQMTSPVDYGGMIRYEEAVRLLGMSRQTFHDYMKKGLIHSEKKVTRGRAITVYSAEEIMALNERMSAQEKRLAKNKVTLNELCDLFDKENMAIRQYLRTLDIEGEKINKGRYYDRESTIMMLASHIRNIDARKEKRKNAAPVY